MKNLENLIMIKTEAGAQLTDRELAVRWWGRLSVEKKREILEKYLPTHDIDIMDCDSVYWVWLKQQK